MQIDNVSFNGVLPLLKSGRASKGASGFPTGFLIEPLGDKISVVSTNQVSETSCLVSAKDTIAGSVSMPAEFAEFVEKCPNQPITLKLTAKRADLIIGGTKARLPVLAGDTFPRMVLGAELHTWTFDSAGLKKALSETAPFAPLNDTRACLNSVLFVVKTGSVVCVASNAHMLSVSTAAANIKVESPIERLLPVVGVRQLIKILDYAAEVEVTVTENAVAFRCANAELRVKPLQERFPNWKAIMTSKPLNVIEIDRREFEGALARAAIFSNPIFPIGLFSIGREGMTVSSILKEGGDAADLIKLSKPTDAVDKLFHANLDYLKLSANIMGTDKIRLSYSTDDHSAIWFRKGESDDCVVVANPCKL